MELSLRMKLASGLLNSFYTINELPLCTEFDQTQKITNEQDHLTQRWYSQKYCIQRIGRNCILSVLLCSSVARSVQQYIVIQLRLHGHHTLVLCDLLLEAWIKVFSHDQTNFPFLATVLRWNIPSQY